MDKAARVVTEGKLQVSEFLSRLAVLENSEYMFYVREVRGLWRS